MVPVVPATRCFESIAYREGFAVNNRLEQVERGRMAAEFLSQAITALRNSGLVEHNSAGENRVDMMLIQLTSIHTDLENVVKAAREAAKQR